MSITQMHPEKGLLTSTIARRVRGLLAELDMDRKDLGPILGVSGSSASKRVRGDMAFGVDELPVLARSLGTSLEYLLGLTDDRRPHRDELDEASGDLRARRDSNPKPSDRVTSQDRVVDLSAWRAQRSRNHRHCAAVPA